MRLSFVSGSSITRQRSPSRRGWGLVLRRGVRGGGVAREIDHGLANARLDRAGFLIACFQGCHDGLDAALRPLGNIAQGVDGFEQFLPPGDLIPLHVGTAAGGVVEPPGGVVDAIKERVELVSAREYAGEDRINLGRAAL